MAAPEGAGHQVGRKSHCVFLALCVPFISTLWFSCGGQQKRHAAAPPPAGVQRRMERHRQKLVGWDKGSLTQHDGTWYGIPCSVWPGWVSPPGCVPSWTVLLLLLLPAFAVPSSCLHPHPRVPPLPSHCPP